MGTEYLFSFTLSWTKIAFEDVTLDSVHLLLEFSTIFWHFRDWVIIQLMISRGIINENDHYLQPNLDFSVWSALSCLTSIFHFTGESEHNMHFCQIFCYEYSVSTFHFLPLSFLNSCLILPSLPSCTIYALSAVNEWDSVLMEDVKSPHWHDNTGWHLDRAAVLLSVTDRLQLGNPDRQPHSRGRRRPGYRPFN